MTQLAASVSTQVSYETMKSLDARFNELGVNVQAETQDLLAEEFHLVPPSLGTRAKAYLASLPVIGWLVPRGQEARQACERHAQRVRQVESLLTGQRALLQAEYAEADAIQGIFNGGVPRLVTDRRIEQFQQPSVVHSAVRELRQISRAMAAHEVAAARVHEDHQVQGEIDTPIHHPNILRTYVYGALNAALAQHVVPHRQGTGDVIARDDRLELRPELRRALLADLRDSVRIQQALRREANAPGLTPRNINDLCMESLQRMRLLPGQDHPVVRTPGERAEERAFDDQALAFWAQRTERLDASDVVPRDQRRLAMRAALLVEMADPARVAKAQGRMEASPDGVYDEDLVQRIEATYQRLCEAERFLDGAGSLDAMSRAARQALDAELA